MYPVISVRIWNPSWSFLTWGLSWSYRQVVVCSWGYLKACLAIPFQKNSCVATAGTLNKRHPVSSRVSMRRWEQQWFCHFSDVLPFLGHCMGWQVCIVPCARRHTRIDTRYRHHRGHLHDCLLWVIIWKMPWNYLYRVRKEAGHLGEISVGFSSMEMKSVIHRDKYGSKSGVSWHREGRGNPLNSIKKGYIGVSCSSVVGCLLNMVGYHCHKLNFGWAVERGVITVDNFRSHCIHKIFDLAVM